MKVLMVGDIVGAPGRLAFARTVARLKAAQGADFVVANAENAAGGRGLTGAIADELLAAGADVITLGDHAWDQKDLPPYAERTERLLRPANFAPGNPGRGLVTVQTGWGAVTVLNLVGRVFMRAYDCPFRTADGLLKKLPAGTVVLVDFHAEATSEKIALGRYLDGRVACVAGSHTHVQTSDERILPLGTAYITDLGMTGSRDSVLGRDVGSVLQTFLTGMPAKFEIAAADVVMEGIEVDIDRATGKAKSIRRFREAQQP